LRSVPVPETIEVYVEYEQALRSCKRVDRQSLKGVHPWYQQTLVVSREIHQSIGVRGNGADAHIVLSNGQIRSKDTECYQEKCFSHGAMG